ncbi:GAD-like domain-containing protein [Micromonospora sp. NPDC049204]|uniref:GAD-like domain-containing protein n=1 Tax=unclassified Micromonospora TaxID=2617518 RepID=UPI0033DF2D07
MKGEAMAQHEVAELAGNWGRPTYSAPVPAGRLAQFAGVVPDLLLACWRHYGFAGFGNGLFWLCDPEVWQPAIDAWTDDLVLPREDRWIAVSRSAFGDVQVWGQQTGSRLTITAQHGWVIHTDRSGRVLSDDGRDDRLYALLMCQDRRSVDLHGADGKPLFDRILALRGPVGPDTIYGFVPALGLGGALRPDRAEIVDGPVHLELLAELSERRVVDNDDLLQMWIGQ